MTRWITPERKDCRIRGLTHPRSIHPPGTSSMSPFRQFRAPEEVPVIFRRYTLTYNIYFNILQYYLNIYRSKLTIFYFFLGDSVRVSLNSGGDVILTSAVGGQGFVSIDGKRTYLNLFDNTDRTPAPSHVQPQPTRTQPPPIIGTG